MKLIQQLKISCFVFMFLSMKIQTVSTQLSAEELNENLSTAATETWPNYTQADYNRYITNMQQRGADINAPNPKCLMQTPLYRAIEHGNTLMALALLARGANTNIPDSKKLTLLHIAACKGNATITQELLNTHAINVNARDKSGMTALHRALESDNLAVARILIIHGYAQLLGIESTIPNPNNPTTFITTDRTLAHWAYNVNGLLTLRNLHSDLSQEDNASATELLHDIQTIEHQIEKIDDILGLEALSDIKFLFNPELNEELPVKKPSTYDEINALPVHLQTLAFDMAIRQGRI